MEPELFTLKNGLTVLIIDTKSFPALTTLLLLNAGSRYENKNNNGIAHFLEHMPHKGSKKYPSPFIISSTLESLGTVDNAFTTKDYVGYWAKGPTDHFETIIDVLSDQILHPLLPPEEIEKEKGVILEEINMYDDRPDWTVGQLFDQLLYKNTPLGWDTLGTRENIRNFNKTTFTDFRSNLYYPNNALLVIAGGLGKLETKEYLKTIEAKFGEWTGKKDISFEKVNDQQDKPEILIKNKKTEQVHFCLGFRTFSYFDKRKQILSVLSAILGSGSSSRLFMEVREKRGLCYYIRTFHDLHADVGNMATQAGVTKDLDKVKKTIALILQEHKKVSSGEIKKEEIHRAKEYLKGNILLSLEDSSNIASFYGRRKLLENIIETPQEVIAKLEKVTQEEIVNLAKEIFKLEQLNLSLIGPFEKDDIRVEDFSL